MRGGAVSATRQGTVSGKWRFLDAPWLASMGRRASCLRRNTAGLACLGLVVSACDSKRLCDGGACDRPSGSLEEGGAHSVAATSAPADAALHDDGGASVASEAGAPGAVRPCEVDGGCGPGGVCHPEANVCVACTSDQHCAAPTPHCDIQRDPADSVCVGCLGHPDCAGGLCIDKRCVTCDVASDVGCEAPAAQCVEVPDGGPRCVECSVDEDCQDPSKTVCDVSTGQCVACTTDGRGCAEGERCVLSQSVEAGAPDASPSPAPQCIECTVETAEDDCRADAPYCVGGRCAVCEPTLDEGCDQARPYCRDGAALAAELDVEVADLGPAVCVECRSDEDCSVGGGVCEGGSCVECRRDDDCTAPGASACDPTSHECVPCSVSSQCKHIEGASVCHVEEASDASSRVSGCVQCDALDYRACDDAKAVCITVPSPSQFTCSERRVNQVGFCGECLADSDCRAEERCVFEESPASGQSGFHCLYLVGAEGAPSSCSETSAEPFTRAAHATSVDGVTGTYCALDTTTCDVFNHFKRSCVGDADCGAPQDGAICQIEQQSGRCTYTCASDVDCPQPNGDCVNGHCAP